MLPHLILTKLICIVSLYYPHFENEEKKAKIKELARDHLSSFIIRVKMETQVV